MLSQIWSITITSLPQFPFNVFSPASSIKSMFTEIPEKLVLKKGQA